ncbi:MAG TPA: leucyl/phenylalanyl-tRNA--protein transferase [Nocardioidaceae bacterium]|nr:leucyl/phenylalanyl-tRNA--protein transferase [Nocardioidaceae bacterium]
MPVVPPPSPWSFPDLSGPDGDAFDDLVGVGADLEPGTLIDAYSRGFFPMPADSRTEGMSWWSPDPRGVLPLRGLRVTRSLRKSVRRYDVRVDTAFDDVVAACGDPERDGGWIDDRIREAYAVLHELGWAHSVEAWRDGRLVGGLYGVAVGGLFAGESMFHVERDASKVALVALVDLLSDEYVDRRLLDVQWQTPHLESLGVVEVPRREYLVRLERALAVPLPPCWS